MNEQNKEVLTKIYQNAKMGSDSISYVNKKSDDESLKSALLCQQSEYSQVASEAAELLNKDGEPAKDKGVFSHACLWGSVQMNTLADKSADHIAEMMMQGSMMGIIDMSRTLKKYGSAEHSAIKLGEKLIETEENNIQQMKSFLG